MWTLRCATACSGRPVQLEGYCVGPKPTSLRRRNVQGGEAAAVRALRGGEPSCAAAPRAETSGTVGLRPEQSSLRRRKEREGRGCAQFLSPAGPEAVEPAAQEGARGKQFRSAAIFGHSRALRETEKPAAQEGARGRRKPTPRTMLVMGSLTLAYVPCMCTPRGCLRVSPLIRSTSYRYTSLPAYAL